MCEILGGKDLVCDSVGGVKTIYGWNTADATVTYANGTVSAITLTAGKYAYPFYIEMETANFSNTQVGDRANQSNAYTNEGTMVLSGNTATDIVNLEALEISRTTFAVELNDGTVEVFFLENGAKVSGVRATGQAYEDANGNTVTMTGKEVNRAPKCAIGLITPLLFPVS